MATIGDKLLELKQIQVDLRTAIEAKGIIVGDAPFSDYPGFIYALGEGGLVGDPVGLWGGDAPTWGGSIVTFGGG